MKRSVTLATVCGAAFLLASGASFASSEDNLDLAISEAQVNIGGTVLAINSNPNDHWQKYDAVVLDPNGILQHVGFDLPVDYIYPRKPITGADYNHWNELSVTRVSLGQAVRNAEKMTGQPAISADFVSSARGKVVAYNVAFAGSSGQPQSVLIDGRNGQQITDTTGLDLTR